MRIIDLSREIYEGMPSFGNWEIKISEVPPLSQIEIESYKGRFRWGVCSVTFGDHTGTHIDAPYHIDPTGMTVDKMPSELFVTEAVLLRTPNKSKSSSISREDLENALEESHEKIETGNSVLLYTGWASKWTSKEYFLNPGLELSAAEWLAEKRVSLVGIDAPNIDPSLGMHDPQQPRPGHFYLLGELGIPHIENLCNLEKLMRNRVVFIILPLKIRGATGSPVRAVAIEDWSLPTVQRL